MTHYHTQTELCKHNPAGLTPIIAKLKVQPFPLGVSHDFFIFRKLGADLQSDFVSEDHK